MALIVEDGAGYPEADCYASMPTVAAYALRQGLVWLPDTDAQGEAAIRRGATWLDTTYRSRFPGYRRRNRDQRREWPRVGAYIASQDYSGYGYVSLPDDAVPVEIVEAQCEAAIRELASPGTLSPDTDQGAAIRSVTADTVSVVFAGDGLTEKKLFPTIALILSTLLTEVSPYGGRTGRG